MAHSNSTIYKAPYYYIFYNNYKGNEILSQAFKKCIMGQNIKERSNVHTTHYSKCED